MSIKKSVVIAALVATLVGVLPIGASLASDPYAESRTFYLKSGVAPVANVESSLQPLSFDPTPPAADDQLSAYASSAYLPPRWTGKIGSTIRELRFDAWLVSRNPQMSAIVSVGDGWYHLGCSTSKVVEPHVFVFSEMYSDGAWGALDIPTQAPDGSPLDVVITLYPSCSSAGAIAFDSAIHPSSFTVFSQPQTDPSPSVTVSPSTSPSPTSSPTPTGPTLPTCPESPPLTADPASGCQWGLTQTNVPAAWALPNASGQGIKVAVIDSGIDLEHEDLACPGKLEVSANAEVSGNQDGSPDDMDGHGTHVAGIIAACTGNGIGMAGVAPDAVLMPYEIYGEALESSDPLDNESMARAIRLAADEGAHIINASWSSLFRREGSPVWDKVSPVTEAVKYAVDRGVLFVAAASNYELPYCSHPSIADEVICVGATNSQGEIASYSNNPHKVGKEERYGLMAPGGDGDCDNESILSLYPVSEWENECPVDGYAYMNGTSMATPHVSGIAALMYERAGGERDRATMERIRAALMSTARDMGEPGYDELYGWGLVDAAAAVAAIPTIADSSLFLSVEGPGQSHQTLQALLVNAETGEPLAGKSISFHVDGSTIGESVTSSEGWAEIGIPGPYRSHGRTYEAKFVGDAETRGSEAQAE